MIEVAKKHGLIYSSDFKSVLGVDSESADFDGTVPSGATYIEEDAFSCCGFEKISLPDSVVSVGANLFCNSSALEVVKLPAGLKSLSPYMFAGCAALTRVEMPSEIQDFSEGLFSGCSSLAEIPFRSTVVTLPENVFAGCTSLVSLVIPNSVTKICSGAISGCSSLKTIVLPASLKEFEPGAIADCPLLSRLRISDSNEFFAVSDDGCVLYKKNEDGTQTEIFAVSNRVAVEIPTLNEMSESENPSIVSFDEEDDEEMEEYDRDSEAAIDGENEVDDKALSSTSDNNYNSEKDLMEEKKMENDDMSSRLADIMKQDKQYSDGEFSIMDIPEASEEEIAADMLSPSKGVVTMAETPAVAETEPVDDGIEAASVEDAEAIEMTESEEVVSASEDENKVAPQEKTVNEQVADIMEQEPTISEEEVGEIVAEGDVGAGEDDVAPVVSAGSEATDDSLESDEDLEKTVLNNLVFEADKVEQQKLDAEDANRRILFVFAEKLDEGQFGKAFSPALTNCCHRLAEIHKYSSIIYFYGIKLDNEKFRNQFIRFMKEKDAVVACSSSTLSTISDGMRDFSHCVGITLEKSEVAKQIDAAHNPNSGILKLVIQDVF